MLMCAHMLSSCRLGVQARLAAVNDIRTQLSGRLVSMQTEITSLGEQIRTGIEHINKVLSPSRHKWAGDLNQAVSAYQTAIRNASTPERSRLCANTI